MRQGTGLNFIAIWPRFMGFMRSCSETNATQHSARRIAELFNLDSRQHVHPIRLIIDASSQADDKTKSRWTRALRFAWHERQHWSDLEDLFTTQRRTGGLCEPVRGFASEATTRLCAGWW